MVASPARSFLMISSEDLRRILSALVDDGWESGWYEASHGKYNPDPEDEPDRLARAAKAVDRALVEIRSHYPEESF